MIPAKAGRRVLGGEFGVFAVDVSDTSVGGAWKSGSNSRRAGVIVSGGLEFGYVRGERLVDQDRWGFSQRTEASDQPTLDYAPEHDLFPNRRDDDGQQDRELGNAGRELVKNHLEEGMGVGFPDPRGPELDCHERRLDREKGSRSDGELQRPLAEAQAEIAERRAACHPEHERGQSEQDDAAGRLDRQAFREGEMQLAGARVGIARRSVVVP